MVTCHCKTLESSTKPAEKPSIGFRVKSVLFFAFVVVVVVLIRRERGKSQYKMLESPLVALLAKIIVHIIIIRERDRQTKQKKDKKNDAPLSWFRNRSTAWSVILFPSLFSRCLFFNKWFSIYHTKTTERSNTNFFAEMRVFVVSSLIINRRSSSESCRCYSQKKRYTTSTTTTKSVFLCECVSV